MAKIKTINNIIEVFRDVAKRHYQINGFGIGDDWEVGADKAYMHPVLWINPIEATMPESENNIGYKSFEITFNIKCYDLVEKDEINENEVLSDTIQILKDIIQEFKGHPYYRNSDFQIIDDIDFEAFTERFDEEVSGWETDFTLKTPLTDNWCGVPMQDIDGFSFPGVECDGYNAVCDVTYVTDVVGVAPIQVTTLDNNVKEISISGITTDDFYTTGTTTINDVVYFDRNSQLSAYTLDLSPYVNTDTNIFVTGVTFNNNNLTLTNNENTEYGVLIDNLTGLTVNGNISGTTYYGDGSNLTNIDNFYTTGVTIDNNIAYFDRTDELSAYTLDLSTYVDNDTFITGGTLNEVNSILTLTRNDGQEIDVELEDNNISKNTASTGIITGGDLTINGGDNTKFDISDGYGYIVDHTTSPSTYTEVGWSGLTGLTVDNLATSFATDIAIDVNGDVLQQNSYTNEELRSLIFLGGLDHNNQTNISNTFELQVPSNGIGSSLYEFTKAVGDINLDGNVFSANGTDLKIQRSSGIVFKYGINNTNNKNNPHEKSFGLESPVTFNYVFNNGSGSGTFLSETTDIDPTLLDDGSGTLSSVGGNNFTIQRILFFGNSGNVFIQVGTETFNKLDDALSNIETTNFEPLNGIRTAMVRGFLVVIANASNLSDDKQAVFIEADKFGSIGARGLGGGALENFSNTNLTLNGDREHNLSGNTLSLIQSGETRFGINEFGDTFFNKGTLSPNSMLVIGHNAGRDSDGIRNVIIGGGAGEQSGLIVGSVYVGSESGRLLTGSSNTLVGERAGFFMTTGSSNTFFGGSTGGNVTGATNTILLGHNTDTLNDDPNNQIVIGAGQISLGDNTAIIGNDNNELVRLVGRLEQDAIYSEPSMVQNNTISIWLDDNTPTIRLKDSGGNESNITLGDTYTTGTTTINDVVYFDRNSQLSAYTLDLSPYINTDTNTFITGVTFNNNNLTLTNNENTEYSVEINNFTGLTVNGDISATTYYGDGSNLSGVSGGDTNFANDNLIFDGNRTHDLTGNTLSLIQSGETRFGINSVGDVLFNKGTLAPFTNVVVGQGAAANYNSGGSVFIGFDAGKNIIGGDNTLIGYESARLLNNSGSNTIIGSSLINNAISGTSNVVIGSNSGRIDTNSDDVIEVGSSILIGNSISLLNTASTRETVIGHGRTGLGDNTTLIGSLNNEIVRLYGQTEMDTITSTPSITEDNSFAIWFDSGDPTIRLKDNTGTESNIKLVSTSRVNEMYLFHLGGSVSPTTLIPLVTGPTDFSNNMPVLIPEDGKIISIDFLMGTSSATATSDFGVEIKKISIGLGTGGQGTQIEAGSGTVIETITLNSGGALDANYYRNQSKSSDVDVSAGDIIWVQTTDFDFWTVTDLTVNVNYKSTN